MIFKLIDEALLEHQFIKEMETDSTYFYRREVDNAIRFTILYKLDQLCSPKELNATINQSLPAVFINNPSFKKNCDLVCIHHLPQLSDFKEHEEQIFAIEEDPHFFKKYVFYYSNAEEHILKNQSYNTLKAIIANKELFNEYKDQPLMATHYSVAAKVFIKLPFFELPFDPTKLVPLRLQTEEAVSEIGLINTYEKIQKLDNNNIDDLIEEMISEELANIQN